MTIPLPKLLVGPTINPLKRFAPDPSRSRPRGKLITGNPLLATPRGTRWDFRQLASEKTPLARLFDLYYGGDDEEELDQIKAREEGDGVRRMYASRPTTKGRFLESFGFDPFKKGAWDELVTVTRRKSDGTSYRAKVKRRDMTMEEAEGLWRAQGKKKRMHGLMLLGSQWVPNTPENRALRLAGKVAVSDVELDRYKRWVRLKDARQFVPAAYQAALEKYALQTRGKLPGIPLELVTRWVTSGAEAALEQKHWFNRGGKPFMKPWSQIEAKMRKGATPGPLLEDQIKRAREKYYKGYRSVMDPLKKRLLPQMVRESLAKKGLVEEWVWMSYTGAPPYFPVRLGTSTYKGMISNGFKEVKRDVSAAMAAYKAGLPGAERPAPKTPLTDIVRRHAVGKDAPYPWLASEEEWRERAKKIGYELDKVRSAMEWAKKAGLFQYAKSMQDVFGTKNAEISVLAMHSDFRRSLAEEAKFWGSGVTDSQRRSMGTPFLRQFRPAHALGSAGFAKWHKVHGFKTPNDFAEHIRIKVIPERIKFLKEGIKSGEVKNKDEARRMIRFYQRSLDLYRKWLSDREGAPITDNDRKGRMYRDPRDRSKLRRVPAFMRNMYGTLVENDGFGYLYAAYYNLFRKGRAPMHRALEVTKTKPKGTRPTRWVIPREEYHPRVTPFIGMVESPHYIGWEEGKGYVRREGTRETPLTYTQAMSLGAGALKRILEQRKKRQIEMQRKAADLPGFDGFLQDVGSAAETILFFPPRLVKLAEGAFFGAADSLGSAVGAWLSGVKKEDLKMLVRPSESDIKRWVTSIGNRYIHPEWKRWRTGQLFTAAQSFDSKMARDMEAIYRKRGQKDLYTNIEANLEDIAVGLYSLPEILLGPMFSQQQMTGRNMGERFMRTIEGARNAGYTMGTGMMNFFYHLASRDTKMLHEAPVDTLLVFLPILRAAAKAGKLGGQKLSPKARRVIEKLLPHLESARQIADRAMGGKTRDIMLKSLDIVAGSTAMMRRRWRALLESLKQAKSGTSTWWLNQFRLRNANASHLLNEIFRKVNTGDDLKQWATEMRELAKKSPDPRLYLEYIDSLRAMLPESVKKMDAVRAVFDEADGLYASLKSRALGTPDPLKKPTIIQRAVSLVSPKRRKAVEAAYSRVWDYFKKIGEKGKKGQRGPLLKALESLIELDLRRRAGDVSAVDIRRMMGFSPDRYLGGGITIKGQSPMWLHSDWFARNSVIQALKTRKVSELRFMQANPAAAIRELQRIAERIKKGKIKEGDNAWLFGEAVDLAAKRENLATKRRAHFWEGKGRLTQDHIDELSRKLRTKKGREGAVAKIEKIIAQIKGLEEFGETGRTALGWKARRTTPHGVIDGQFQSLSRALKDGTGPKVEFAYLRPGEAPGIYVPRGVNEAFRTLTESKKPGAPPVLPAIPEGLTKAGMIKLVAQANEELKALGLEGIQPRKTAGGRQLTWDSVHKMTPEEVTPIVRQALYDAALKGSKLPKPISKLVERLYNIQANNFQAIVQTLGRVKTAKAAALMDKFNEALRTQGPVAAFNKLFGVKGKMPFRHIEQMPGVLNLLVGKGRTSSTAAAIINNLRNRLIFDVIGRRKAVRYNAESLAATLDGAAQKLQGAEVRKWWEALSGPGDEIAKGRIKQQIQNGVLEVDIAPVFTTDPKVLIRELLDNKDALLAQAKSVGVSESRFFRSYSQTLQRLRRFKELQPGYGAKFGLNPGERVWVPRQVNTALFFQNIADTRIGPIARFMKLNVVARNLRAVMNNLQSGVGLVFARSGHLDNPFKYRKLLEAMRGMQSLKKSVRDKATALFEKQKKRFRITDDDLRLMREIQDVGNFLDSGMFDVELGGRGKLVSSFLLKPIKGIEGAHRFTDIGFKFNEAIRQGRMLHSFWDDLKVGQTTKIEIQQGVWLNLRKTANGADVLSPKGTKLRTIGQKTLRRRIAEAASVPADMMFGNYANLPKWQAFLRSPSLQGLGAAMPFLTWFYKALYVPGVKRGIPGEMFRPFAPFKTKNATVLARQAKMSLATGARVSLALSLARERLSEMDPHELRQVFSWLPAEIRPIVMRDLVDDGFMGTKDLEYASPFGPTRIILRLLRNRSWAWGKKGELLGPEGEMFEGHWIGQVKGGKPGQGDLLFNLTGERAEKLGYSKRGKLTEKGKRVLALRKMISRNMRRGSGAEAFDWLQLIQMTGGIAKDMVTLVNSTRKKGASADRFIHKASQSLMGVLLGGTLANAIDVGIGIADPKSPFSSRHRVPLTPSGESAMRFAIRRITGMGYTIKDVAKDKKKSLDLMARNYRQEFLGTKRKTGSIRYRLAELDEKRKKKGLSDDEITEYQSLKVKEKRISRIVDEEMLRFDHAVTLALNLRAAMAKRKRKGKAKYAKPRLRWSRYYRYKTPKGYSYRIRKKPSIIQQLYKVGRWSNADNTRFDQSLIEEFKFIRTGE